MDEKEKKEIVLDDENAEKVSGGHGSCYSFECHDCGAHGVRYSQVFRCPRCGSGSVSSSQCC